MGDKIDKNRNRPSESGMDNDPGLRDDSAIQPGISTISSSDSDEADDNLTKTTSDDFLDNDFGEGADKSFDEVEEDD